MDPIELEGMDEGLNMEGTSSSDENLSMLSDEGAAEMAIYREQIANLMWAQRNN